MKKIYIVLASFLVLATSCSIYRYEEHQSVEVQPKASGVITTTTADMNVSANRINHTMTFDLNNDQDDLSIKDVKEKTLSAALAKYNADVLVGMLYDITTSESGNQMTVTVTGYPATYTNFRPITAEDSVLIAAATPIADAMESNITSHLTKDFKVLRRWQSAINLTYGLKVRPGIEYQGGYRFNNWGLIGLGFGYSFNLNESGFAYQFTMPSNGQVENGHWNMQYMEYNCHYVPVYALFRVYILGKKRVNPFLGIQQGVGLCIRTILDEPATRELTIGSHTRGEIGVNFRLNTKNSVSFAYNIGLMPSFGQYYYPELPYEIPYGSNTYFVKEKEHKLYNGFTLGITF